MSEVGVVLHADAQLLAQAVAARLVIKVIDAQAERGQASVVLTGGRVAAAVYRAVLDLPARDAVDWSRVDVWWGDERFLPAGHPDRNETQARAAFLDGLPIPASGIHPMPASDGPDGNDPEAAASRYAAELAAAARPGTAALPHFDVLMLGVGEDAHVASIFPEHPVVYETRPVSAVRGSPKPPPVRTTLTLPAINTADEVWLMAAGADKSAAVGMALAGLTAGAAQRNPRADRPATSPVASGRSADAARENPRTNSPALPLALAGAGPVQVPAAGVHGVTRTLWLLDRAAAAGVRPAFHSLR